MGNNTTYYFVGAIALLFGFYQMYITEMLEATLYTSVGLAFIAMALVKNEVFPEYQKILNIVSWVLIAVAVIVFLYVILVGQHIPEQ